MIGLWGPRYFVRSEGLIIGAWFPHAWRNSHSMGDLRKTRWRDRYTPCRSRRRALSGWARPAEAASRANLGEVCKPTSTHVAVVSVASDLTVTHHVGGHWDCSAQRPVGSSWVEPVVMLVLANRHDDTYGE